MRQRLAITEANRKWWILAATGGSLAVVLFDGAIFVALPTIRDEFDLSGINTQWVVNAYVLTLTVFVAAAGRLGDIVGHRVVFIVGAVVLGLGSIWVGVAQGDVALIVGRAIQGAGTAAVLSPGIAMTGIAFAESERGLALGIYGVIGSASAAVAPFMGGLATDAASWRLIPLANVALVIILVAMILVAWREPEHDRGSTSLDGPGLTSLLAFLVPLVIALMQAPAWGWGSTAVIGLLVFSALALWAFVWAERRAEHPLIDLTLLRRPTIVGSNVVIVSAQFGVLTIFVFGALYLQDRLGMSALLAGTALLAAAVPMLFTGVWAGQLSDRYGSRIPTLAGVAVSAAGLLWLAVLVPIESYLILIPGFVLWSLALSFLFTPPQTAVMNTTEARKRGEAAGILGTGRQVGGTLAVAVLGSVLLTTDSFGAVFAIAAGVTIVVWIVAFLTIQRGGGGAPVPQAAD